MRCKHCGQIHNKKCIFDYENSIKILQFFIVTYINISKFNDYYYKFPNKELYDCFALLNNFLNSEEIEELYKEEYIDILLLVIESIENDSLFKKLIFGNEKNEEIEEMFVDDSSFILEDRIIKNNYLILRERFSIKEKYLNSINGKNLYELNKDIKEGEVTWQVLKEELTKS